MNMQYWEKVKQPVAGALKTIKAGRLKGMSDISPQWRFYAMTETFGPVGIGWKYTVDKQWIEPGSYEQSCAFTNISLYIKHDGEWSAAIPGTGGSAFIAKETKTDWDTKIKSDFLFTSDEAFKMSLTDALSVAMKAIGVAANIYSGNQDYSKYTAPESGTTPQPQQQRQTSTKPAKEDKGWFDKYPHFQDMKTIMLNKLISGETKSTDDIIRGLTGDGWKINKEVRALIKDLATEAAAAQ